MPFQQLLGNKDCTDFYFQLSSRARKWGAILTSITQHVRSVLDNEDARRMLSDCGYIKLLNQSPDDANDLARLLHISNEEKRYIENAEVGSGLLIVSKTVVPFNNDFPKDTELFRLMDTSGVSYHTGNDRQLIIRRCIVLTVNLGIAGQTRLGLQAQGKLRHFFTVLGCNFRTLWTRPHNA